MEVKIITWPREFIDFNAMRTFILFKMLSFSLKGSKDSFKVELLSTLTFNWVSTLVAFPFLSIYRNEILYSPTWTSSLGAMTIWLLITEVKLERDPRSGISLKAAGNGIETSSPNLSMV
jgi:hypothetical protein